MRLSDIEALAKEHIEFVKDTELAFHAGGDTRLHEGVLKLIALVRSVNTALRATKRGREIAEDKGRKYGVVVD